jgi:hypothetical protein
MKKQFNSNIIKFFNILYCLAMGSLCCTSSILLLLGLFKNILLFQKISAIGFSIICIITVIYQIIESKIKHVVNIRRIIICAILIIVAITLFIISFYY